MIEVVETKERLVNLSEFRNSDELCFVNTPTYWCESCDDTTQFKLDWKRPFEPLEIEQEFNAEMGSLKEYEEGYCNFECRVCSQKVRCIYEILEHQMSSYVYFPKKILILLN